MIQPPKLRREDLRSGPVEVLSRGGWGNPDVLLCQSSDGECVVLKDFSPRPAWVRWSVGRWITRREVAAYRALEGVPEVPRIIGVVDALAFVLEYRPGEILTRSLIGRIPECFVEDLTRAVAAMHRRGVVHLDLRHRSNILADERGRPVILDLASAVRLRPGSWAHRLLMRRLAAFDERALEKWRDRLGPSQLLDPASPDGTTSAGSRGASREM